MRVALGLIGIVTAGTGTVTGVLSAIDVSGCPDLNPALCPDGRTNGLRLGIGGLGVREEFNRSIGLGGVLNAEGDAATEFVVFELSAPVDIGSVVVADAANNGCAIWYAFGTEAVEFDTGSEDAIASLTLLNGPDEASDGMLEDAIGREAITTLIVGAPFNDEAFAGITPAGTIFFINGFSDVSAAATGPVVPPTPVPVPLSALLLLTGIVGLAVLGQRTAQA